MNNKRMYIYQTFLSKDRNDLGQFHNLNELKNQIEYIAEMGFTHIQVNPIFQSEDNCYHMYHCTDFYQVDKSFGTMEDFMLLLEELNKFDMRIILDMVIDKTSTQHWWYKDFIQGKNQFYIAREWKENDCDPGIGSRSIYNWDSTINKWVISPFGGFLPALNVNNWDVRNEIAKVIKYWLSKGNNIDLRIDGIYHTRWATRDFNPIPFCDFLRKTVDEIDPNIQLIGEVFLDGWQQRDEPIPYAESLGNTYNFADTFNIIRQINSGKTFNDIYIENPYKRSIIFLGSHDTARVASMLGNNIEKVKLFIKVVLEKSNADFSFYYGGENMFNGFVDNGYDLPVRQNHTVFDMANVIKDKNSLFYYIKDLIAEDKEKRKHNK